MILGWYASFTFNTWGALRFHGILAKFEVRLSDLWKLFLYFIHFVQWQCTQILQTNSEAKKNIMSNIIAITVPADDLTPNGDDQIGMATKT